MGVQYNEIFQGYKTAKALLQAKPALQNKDGIYTLCPDGTINSATQVYCDMTTDGGGWMLLARSHYISGTDINPSTSGSYLPLGTWGWLGLGTGNINDYSKPYQIPW